MIIDGKKIAAEKTQILVEKVAKLQVEKGVRPNLLVFLVGNDAPSEMYVSLKAKKAVEVGIASEIIKLPQDCTDTEIMRRIQEANSDQEVHGILVQLPFPGDSLTEANTRTILDTIDPKKDVDCLTSANMGLLIGATPRFYPATVRAVLSLLSQTTGQDLLGRWSSYRKMKYLLAEKDVVIIGRSEIVGKPMAISFINLGATVTVCNAKTAGLSTHIRHADILITGAGVPELVKAHMVKPGSTVIDVGIYRLKDGRVVGDVDFPLVFEIASLITPVPGGVGPMTIISLLENVTQAASQS